MSSFEIGASRPVGAVRLDSVTPASAGVTQPDTTATPQATSATPEVQTSVATAAGTVPVDQDRVTQIRQAVQDGTYPIIPTRIGDAMIAAGALLRKA
jgi:negative regulator of flagellin synthesis FlgM